VIRAFFEIAGFYLSSLVLFFRSKSLRFALLKPYLYGVVTWIATLSMALIYNDEIQALLGFMGSWTQSSFFGYLVLGLSPILATLVSVIVLVAAINLTLDSVVAAVFEQQRIEMCANSSLAATTGRLLVEAALRGIATCGLLLLVLLSIFIPFLNILSFLIGAIYLGGDLFTSCLSSSGVSIRDQKQAVKKNISGITALGIVSTVLLIIPFIGMLMLPIAYLAAAQLVAKVIKQRRVEELERYFIAVPKKNVEPA
jgi:uncharacterized protein involved in cysteine biosynthesis